MGLDAHCAKAPLSAMAAENRRFSKVRRITYCTETLAAPAAERHKFQKLSAEKERKSPDNEKKVQLV